MAAPPITPTRAARHQQQQRPQGKERKQPAPSRSRLRKVLRWTLWLAVPAVAVAAGTVIGLIYAFARVPLPSEIPTAQTIVFLDGTGRHEIGTLSAQENRRVVRLDKIPEDARRAVLAAEDRDFYEHGAISWRGLARATAANVLRRRISEGGSTITQQYVKNAFPGVGRDRTLFRKLKEAVLAVKLERKFSKDQILEFYMNTVYYGRGAYGIDAAARTYFKQKAEDLKPAQSALLAGVIRSPEFYGKKEHQVSAKARRNYILQAMVDRGWLSAKDGPKAMASKLGVSWKAKGQGIANSRAPFFLEKVRQYLVARYGAEAVNAGGLRVRTTLDLKMQTLADQTVKRILDDPIHDPKAALVAIDPRNGAVRAMYGGRSYKSRQWNYATDSIRQAGSTMKPFVLAQALNAGISVNAVFPGPAKLIVDGEPFSNYGNTNYGPMTLRDATRLSVNTIYVQLMQTVGPAQVVKFAKAHGLEAELDGRGGTDRDPRPLEPAPDLDPVLSQALGSGSVTTLQLASAFGTWANRGVHQTPHLVERVVDSRDRVLEDNTRQPGRQVIPQVHADTMNMVLKGAVESGTGTEARLPDREVAGKTGTTDDYADARFVGYTPNLVTSVWLGFERPKEHKLIDVRGLSAVSGGTLPARIWHDFMLQATRDRPPDPFAPPAELGGQVLNPTTTAPPVTVPQTTQPQPNPSPPQPTLPPPTQPGPSLPPPPSTQPGQVPGPTIRG
jgi:penicillin-binding protein 1A